MDGVEIVAYKAFGAVDLRGATLADRHFASLFPQGDRNHPNERRKHTVDPLAYFRSKTVQTMGGSSLHHPPLSYFFSRREVCWKMHC